MTDDSEPYRVRWSIALPLLEKLYESSLLNDAASSLRLARAVRTIVAALQRDPLQWGEPKYEEPRTKLMVCIGFHDRYCVRYGVHIEKRTVYIRSIEDLARLSGR